MIDTNTIALLIQMMSAEKGHQNSIWSVIVAGTVLALPGILTYLNSRKNTASLKVVNEKTDAQTDDIKEIHAVVAENKGVQEQIHQIVNSGKTAMEVRIAEQDRRIIELEKKLSVASEKLDVMTIGSNLTKGQL